MSGTKTRERVTLPKLEEFSTALRTMVINIGFFAATLLLIPAVGAQFTRSAVIIEPIAVPKVLAERGLTPEVVANRLWDGLQAFAQSASAARETVVAIPDSQLIEFSLPDTGISIDSIFTQVRQFFGAYDTRISGEFLCATSDCGNDGLRLRLRVVRSGSDIIDLPAMGALDEAAYYREAAAGVFGIIDPYVAIAAQAESAPLRAATLARQLIADGTRDAKWAHNLVGDIERKGGKPDRAIAAYEAALAIDPDFNAARAGLAQAFADKGDVDSAKAALAEIERRAPANTLAPKILAEIALEAGDSTAAIAEYRIAAQREPLNPEHLTRAGETAIAMGDAAQGVGLLEEALAIDPAYGEALSLLARAHIEGGDLAAAEAAYRQWLDYEPGNIDAQESLGNVQLAFKRYSEAVKSFDKALALRPGDPAITRNRAGALIALNRIPEAIEALVAVTAGGGGDATSLLLLGKAYLLDGNRDLAIAAFERALAAVPEETTAAAARAAIEKLKAGG